MRILGILGSPSGRSRSAALLRLALGRVGRLAHEAPVLAVKDLPADALLAARTGDPAIAAALGLVERADLVFVATPIYKASYTGLLKAFLDLLPQEGLRGKTVLPLATGGSLAHFLSIDYALKPVLSALGARDILDAVYASDDQLIASASGGYQPANVLAERIDRALQPVTARLPIAA